MWRSVKTVSRDIRGMQSELSQTIELHQKEGNAVLLQILSELKTLQDGVNRGIQELQVQIEELKTEINDKMSVVDHEIKDCSTRIAEIDKKAEEFTESINHNLSMLDEGARLIITNMLLDEIGDN